MTILKSATLVVVLSITASAGLAANCGNTGSGFEAWKTSFAKDAKKSRR